MSSVYIEMHHHFLYVSTFMCVYIYPYMTRTCFLSLCTYFYLCLHISICMFIYSRSIQRQRENGHIPNKIQCGYMPGKILYFPPADIIHFPQSDVRCARQQGCQGEPDITLKEFMIQFSIRNYFNVECFTQEYI